METAVLGAALGAYAWPETSCHSGCAAVQVGARMKQYEDELARKRLMSDHELQRQVRMRVASTHLGRQGGERAGTQ